MSPSITLLTATVTPPAGAFLFVAAVRAGSGFLRELGLGFIVEVQDGRESA